MAAIEAEALQVPRVEATQVAGRARDTEVLDGALDEPFELGEHLRAGRRRIAGAQ